MNKYKEQMKDVKLLVLNIVIIVLAIVMCVVLGMAVEEVQYAFSDYEISESSFLYNMEQERYGDMVEDYYQNCGSFHEEEKKMREYYGVAKYYEAAFFYKIYAENGDVERAQKYAAEMENATTQMGDFSFTEEKIDQKLGIEK